MAKQQRARRRHLRQPALHQAAVVGIVKAVGAQQQRVVRQATLPQAAGQRLAAAVLDHPALEARAGPRHPGGAAHRQAARCGALQYPVTHARQVVHMLVAIEKIGLSTGGRHKGRPLRRQFGMNRRQRQQAGVRQQQQARQGRQLRPAGGQRCAQRPAFAQIEVQPGLRLPAQRRHLRTGLPPCRPVAEAGKRRQPPGPHQRRHRLVNGGRQTIVIGAQQQRPAAGGLRHRPCGQLRPQPLRRRGRAPAARPAARPAPARCARCRPAVA